MKPSYDGLESGLIASREPMSILDYVALVPKVLLRDLVELSSAVLLLCLSNTQHTDVEASRISLKLQQLFLKITYGRLCSRQVILAAIQICWKGRDLVTIFSCDGRPQKKLGNSSMLLQALCSISYPLVNLNWSYSPETPNLGKIRRFLAPCDLEIWRMNLKNNRAPLLSNIKLYVSFHHHMWIQTGVTVRKRLIGLWPLWTWPLTSDLDLLHGRYPGPRR